MQQQFRLPVPGLRIMNKKLVNNFADEQIRTDENYIKDPGNILQSDFTFLRNLLVCLEMLIPRNQTAGKGFYTPICCFFLLQNNKKTHYVPKLKGCSLLHFCFYFPVHCPYY